MIKKYEITYPPIARHDKKRARKRVNADLLRTFCAKAALVLLRRRAAAGRLFSIDALGWPCMIGLGDVSLA